jgi:hypothetical protein
MRVETPTDLPSDFLIGNQWVQLSAKNCQLGKGKTVDMFLSYLKVLYFGEGDRYLD